MTPRVTFLLPVHNHRATIAATIHSILAQTYGNFELLILDDASSDGTADILRSLRDPRIELHRHETNLELTRTLHRGLAMARGDYIARIDADDLCLPERTSRQVAFLEAHPHIAAAGSWIQTIDDAGLAREVVRYPTEPADVAAAFLFRNPLAHPAVMLRKAAFASRGLNYDESFRRGQDFDLWVRCIVGGLALANVPEVLLRYRVHDAQVSRRDAAGVRETGARVRARLLAAIGLRPAETELTLHEKLSWDELLESPPWLRAAGDWLEKIHRANQVSCLLHPDAAGRVLCGRWVRVARAAKALGAPLEPGVFSKYLQAEVLEQV